MDEFAQTRGADDLFDDDFTPIAETVVETFSSQPKSPPNRGRGGATPRGKGNRAADSLQRQTKSEAAFKAPETKLTSTNEESSEHQTIVEDTPDPPSEPTAETPHTQFKPPAAVRGDRTATGGAPKPKLTEEELSARLAAAKLNNAKRAEAHRLAEADEASFHQREAHASQKRKEEGQAKRIMNMEREKNRLRKLGSQAGREWDEGKEEQDSRQERGSQYRRGAHGGVTYDGQRGERGGRESRDRINGYQDGDYNQDFQDRRGGYRGQGRGDQGRGRGRGRGNFDSHRNNAIQAPPDPVADFPALPTASSSTKLGHGKPPDSPIDLATGNESWADEVQSAKSPEGGW